MEYSEADIRAFEAEAYETHLQILEQELQAIQEQADREKRLKQILCPTIEECMEILKQEEDIQTK